MKIKDWNKFQHYKHGSPKWIKLHRALLDDMEWHNLDGEAAKLLTTLWMLAAETDGNLPSIEAIAFRVRKNIKYVQEQMAKLDHWIETALETNEDGSRATLEELYARVRVESEESKSKSQSVPKGTTGMEFDEFWKSIPDRKPGNHPKEKTKKAYWKAVQTGADPTQVNAAAKRWMRDEAHRSNKDRIFIPMASTWLNEARYLDYIVSSEEVAKSEVSAEFMAAKGYVWENEKWVKTTEATT